MTVPWILCIVEGDGETKAVPTLVNRILRQLRRHRTILADDRRVICTHDGSRITEPHAPERRLGIEYYVQRAAREKPAGILVVVDAEDRCRARAQGQPALGPELVARGKPFAGEIPLGVVVANPMFEAWFLADFHSLRSRRLTLAFRDHRRVANPREPRRLQGSDEGHPRSQVHRDRRPASAGRPGLPPVAPRDATSFSVILQTLPRSPRALAPGGIAMLSLVRNQIVRELHELLDDRRVVVWYDPSQDFAALFDDLDDDGVQKVDARRSMLKARRVADHYWTAVAHPSEGTPSGPRLLIYVPWGRAATDEAKVQEPFEAYACIGAHFGVDPAQSLRAFAHKALPQRTADIDRLYSEHRRVTLTQLEALARHASYPLLKQGLGTDDAIEVAARVIVEPDQVRVALAGAGVQSDLARLLRESFGFEAPSDETMLRLAFRRWVLFSEFAFDVDGRVPEHAASVPRATTPFRNAIYSVCDRVRGAEQWREGYIAAATEVEKEVRLGSLPGEASSWGERDTFAAEDTAALQFVQAECLAGRLEVARRTIDVRRHSIWRRELERGQLWTLASRALELLEAGRRWTNRATPAARPVADHVRGYAADGDGLWLVDRAQRWMERAAGDCVEREVLQPLVERTQAVYRQAIDCAQQAFLEAVVRDGWPPEGPLQIRVFARHVAPAVQAGERVAYFLLDALRYEMGRDLGQMLDTLGTVHVEPTATVVPTTTTFGMAALLPGADTGFGCAVHEGGLVPTVAGKAMLTVEERKGRFLEQFGDRYVDLRLDELQDANVPKMRKLIGRATLLVVRSDDSVKAGEGTNLLIGATLHDVDPGRCEDEVAQRSRCTSRRHPAGLRGGPWARAVPRGPARRCAEGPRRVVAASPRSDGARLGTSLAAAGGGARRSRDVARRPRAGEGCVALATGFRVFAAGAGFFHEGISLQECIVPTVVLALAASAKREDGGVDNVEVSYRQDRFSQRVFVVKLKLSSLLHAHADVHVAVVEPGGGASTVGRAADSDARDPATGLIRLRTGTEEAVAIRVDDEFDGREVEIQVLDGTGTGVVLGKKKLKNGCSL